MSLFGYVEECERAAISGTVDLQSKWQGAVAQLVQHFHVHVRNPYERHVADMTPETRATLTQMRDELSAMLLRAGQPPKN